MSIRIGSIIVHLDALVARIVYPWRMHAIMVAAIVLITLGLLLARPALITMMQPVAPLAIVAHERMTITVDGRPWPSEVRAGPHRIVGVLDNRTVWRDVVATAHPMTVTLHPGWKPIDVSPVALATHARLSSIRRTGAGVRLEYRIAETDATMRNDGAAHSGAAHSERFETVLIRQGMAERFVSADAYNGLYDEDVGAWGRVAVWAKPAAVRNQFTVTLAVDEMERATASVAAPSVRAIIADARRQQAIIGIEDGAITQLIVMRADGTTAPIGAARGTLVWSEWTPDRSACALSFLDRASDSGMGRFVLIALALDPSPSMVHVTEWDAPPGVVAPPVHVMGQRVVWVHHDGDRTVIRSTGVQDRRVIDEASIDGRVHGIGADPSEGVPMIIRRVQQTWEACRVRDDGLECVAVIDVPVRNDMTFFFVNEQDVSFVVAVNEKEAWLATEQESIRP